MLRRMSLPRAFAFSAVVAMALAAGAVFQLERSPARMLEALAPAWAGIGAVFWLLWRTVSRRLRRPSGDDPPP